MQREITRIVYKNSLENTGDDMVLVEIFYAIDGSPELHIPTVIPLDHLLFEIIAVQYPAQGKYLKRLYNGIGGYGPKHSKLLEILDEEGFDLDQHVKDYFFSVEEDWFRQQIEINASIEQPEAQERIAKSLEELDAFLNDDFRNSNIKSTAFNEAIDKGLHETTHQFYPELFELGEKHVFIYEQVLQRTVLNFTEEIYNIRVGKFSEYLEERYEDWKQSQ